MTYAGVIFSPVAVLGERRRWAKPSSSVPGDGSLMLGREGRTMEIRGNPEGLMELIVTAPEFDASFNVSGEAPVQGFGTVLGRDLYFRARHERWSFEVADHEGRLPSEGYRDSDGFYREAEYPKASYMPLREAVKFIVRCLREYTGAFEF